MDQILSLFRSRNDVPDSSWKPKIERRTGQYSIIIQERCNYYAEFMNHLSRAECDAIFWSLLFTIISLLGAVVYLTQKAHRISQLQPDIEKGLHPDHLAHKSLVIRRKLFFVSLICFLLAVLSTIMAAFAGLAISWCFGEDLINFYWSFWTLVDIGSVIAMLGTVLQQWYSLSSEGISQPAWNFALGTPIPVLATIMHCLGFKGRRAWKSYTERRRVGRERERGGSNSTTTTNPSSSSSSTKTATPAQKTASIISLSTAKFLSFTPDGKCIIEIEMPSHALKDLKLPESFHQRPSSSGTTSHCEFKIDDIQPAPVMEMDLGVGERERERERERFELPGFRREREGERERRIRFEGERERERERERNRERGTGMGMMDWEREDRDGFGYEREREQRRPRSRLGMPRRYSVGYKRRRRDER